MAVAAPVRPLAPRTEPGRDTSRGSRRESLSSRLARRLGSPTDLAPLCAFRVAFGALLIVWYVQLAPDMGAFYSDSGMLPRSALLALDGNRFSLLYTAVYDWQTWLFWLASLAIAGAVLAGYRTRLACTMAFVSLVSFQARNPLVLDGSDIVFRIVAFWLIFTPAGARYSIDSLRRRRAGSPPGAAGLGFPVAILRLQVAWIFLATGLEKLAGPSWLNGTALYYVFQLSHTFARPWASALAANSLLVRLGTWGALSIELWFFPAVFLGLLGRRARLAIVLGAAMMFVGVFLTMDVGNFPLVMEACLLLFVPASFAERLAATGGTIAMAVSRVAARALPSMWRAAGGRVLDLRTAAPATCGPPDARSGSLGRGALPFVGWTCLAVAAAGAMWTALPSWLADYRPPLAIDQVAAYAGLEQRWDMFAPDPTRTDGWLAGPGWLEDGTRVDVVNGGVYSPTPRFANPLYSRWAKVVERIVNPDYDGYRPEFARMYCRRYNDRLGPGRPRLQTFELVFVARDIPPPGRGAPAADERTFWTHAC